MGIKDLASKTANVAARAVEKKTEREPRTAPVQLYDLTARMHAAEQRAEELEAKLKVAEANGHQELSLDKVFEATGRKRNLSNDEFNELVENLRQNPLVTPITVRPTDTGKYEIVSGHNRAEAYRQLGRTTIPAVIQNIDDAQADINAFYANLLQPSLPDYEKYLGFSMIKRRRPELTHEEIADMAGVSRSHVTKLMAFAALPSEALEALEGNVRALGANAAVEFASLAKKGKHSPVIDAIKRLAAGEIDQAAAVAQATKAITSESTPQKPARPKPEVRTFKQGKATYCNLRRVEKTIRIDFKDPEEAAAIELAITELLEERAKVGKEKN